MSDKNEPAFPVQDCAVYQFPGMTLRDYFAGQALAAIITAMNQGFEPDGCGTFYDHAAQASYRFADAMMIERERGQ